MKEKSCYVCDKKYLNRDEIGLTQKLLDKDSKRFYCLDCLSEYLEVDSEILVAMVKEFKEQGCDLF